jgi:transposase
MNPSSLKESEIAAWVGLDWADQQHQICLQAAADLSLEFATIKQQPEALQAWVSQLRARFAGGKVVIALEQSRGALVYALMAYDFLVLYPIPPKSLARYRETFRSSGSKDDTSDAALLLDLVRHHRDQFQSWVPADHLTRQLDQLSQHRRTLVDQKTQLTNQLTSGLKTYFPQALDWAGALETVQACDFLERWPTLEALQKTRPATLRKFYLKHHSRRPELIQQRLEQIGQAEPLTRDPAVIAASSLMVRALVAQLRALLEWLPQLDQQLETLFAQHPDHEVFASFPGAGPVLAPRLQVAFGTDRSRFQKAVEIQQLSGMAPITKQSGRTRLVQRRWARPHFLHQTFYEFAGASLPWCGWARAVYQQQRDRGKNHAAAVRVVGYKWIRILFRCWKKGVPYDEQIYLDALRRRNPQLLKSIEALSLRKSRRKAA